MSQELLTYQGGCHCGAVRFQVKAPAKVHVYKCNCSVCEKKQNDHFIVPDSRFQLLQGDDKITTYTFNTHKAKHTFCKICGVQSFYKPRSNPDGYGIMPHCLDNKPDIEIVEEFDGKNWESHIETTNIRDQSKD
ncbi:hypothetical protein ACF0H5_017786 [Mactra antiquata]